jgi:thiol-disulfide isomerase/thioredoxin
MDEFSGLDEVRRRRGQPECIRILGGLPTVIASAATHRVVAALAVAGMFGCEDKSSPPAPPKERSQAVQLASAVATMPAPAPPTATPAPERQRPVLCAQQLGQPGKDAPKSAVSRAGKDGSLPEKMPFGHGAWTWINLWAAWCVPCKEEMPMLRSWQTKLAGERVPLKVLFVSIDDDARQLETFLGSQPETGTRSTYWLRDGKERAAWLKEVGYSGDPELPAHVLVDPSGKIRCRQQGAVEESDYGEVVKILQGLRGNRGAGAGGENEHGLGGGPKR